MAETSPRITFDESQNMPYLQLVLKEGMRIHPATGLPMWRDVPKGGMTIAGTYFPEGATVGINSWVAHHNTSIFGNDASTFLPERWDPSVICKEDLARMEGAFILFGAGTRTCIGKKISLLEINKLIPELIRRYDFEIVASTASLSQNRGPKVETTNHWFVKHRDVMVRVRRAM